MIWFGLFLDIHWIKSNRDLILQFDPYYKQCCDLMQHELLERWFEKLFISVNRFQIATIPSIWFEIQFNLIRNSIQLKFSESIFNSNHTFWICWNFSWITPCFSFMIQIPQLRVSHEVNEVSGGSFDSFFERGRSDGRGLRDGLGRRTHRLRLRMSN